MPVIKIERIVHNGLGLGKLADGKNVFVPYVLEDESVEVNLLEIKKDYAISELKNILISSSHRLIPKCYYYTQCGGCQLQHTLYENQLTIKKKTFIDTLERLFCKGLKDAPIDIIKSPKEFHYRHSVTLKVNHSGHLGFNKFKSNHIHKIDSCLLAHEEINKIISLINNSPHITSSLRQFKSITIELCPTKKKLHLIAHSQNKNIQTTLNNLISLPISSIKVVSSNKLLYNFSRDETYHRSFSVFDKTLLASPGVFMQHNWDVNILMLQYLREFFDKMQFETIVDFHAGVGNFILPLSKNFKKKIACDINMDAIIDLKKNIKSWGENIEAYHKDAECLLNELISKGEKVDVVLLDPPRGGCKSLVSRLKDLDPTLIIYVSCDPPSLARDLKILKDNGFLPLKITLFDMFPQTFHIESVTILKRS